VRLLVLTARTDLAVNRRFEEAASALGVALETIDGTAAAAVAASGSLSVAGNPKLRLLPDGVIARIGNWRPDSMLAILESLAGQGVATANSPIAIRQGRDHWATIRTLAEAGLPVPETVAGADPEILAALAVERLGLPVVVKQRRSRMGVGVIRATTRDHLEAVLDSLWRLGDEFVVQRWIEGGGLSLRLLVVDGQVVAAARLQAATGDWRSNAARGGVATAYRPSDRETMLAVAAASALRLGHCGIDLIPSEHGPMVLEANPTPGFLRLENATGVDVASALVRSTVRLARPSP
jgi:RimK family alpha-L-glutamate ligase